MGIILVVLSLCAFTFAGIVWVDNNNSGALTCLVALGLFIISLVTIHVGKPTALDVYKGKTTLQITYKNKVPIDSTVVYK